MAVRVNEGNFEAEVLKARVLVLVEFYSDSCIPCKQMSPILSDLEEEYDNNLKVVKVNQDFDNNLAETYKIMASPTILLFKNGEEVNRIRGVRKKPELEKIMKELL